MNKQEFIIYEEEDYCGDYNRLSIKDNKLLIDGSVCCGENGYEFEITLEEFFSGLSEYLEREREGE